MGDADPHNAMRGFFFAHMGWLYVKKHPEVIRAGKELDFSDLYEDSVVMFQKKLDPWFALYMCFVFPAQIAVKFWGASFWPAFFVAGALRYMLVLHFTWLVNSAAHLYGDIHTMLSATHLRIRMFHFLLWERGGTTGTTSTRLTMLHLNSAYHHSSIPASCSLICLQQWVLFGGESVGLLHGIWDGHEETEIIRLEFLFPSLCQGPGRCLLPRLFRPNKIEVLFSLRWELVVKRTI